jgi:hypothetical protein
MSYLSLMTAAYLVGGLFVILDMHQQQTGDVLHAERWSRRRPLVLRLKMQIMRVFASLVILLVWPAFVAAEWSARRRYRMASFLDEDPC